MSLLSKDSIKDEDEQGNLTLSTLSTLLSALSTNSLHLWTACVYQIVLQQIVLQHLPPLPRGVLQLRGGALQHLRRRVAALASSASRRVAALASFASRRVAALEEACCSTCLLCLEACCSTCLDCLEACCSTCLLRGGVLQLLKGRVGALASSASLEVSSVTFPKLES